MKAQLGEQKPSLNILTILWVFSKKIARDKEKNSKNSRINILKCENYQISLYYMCKISFQSFTKVNLLTVYIVYL